MYSVMPVIVQDSVAAPALQAFVGRLFSMRGMLTACRRNRLDKPLKMRTVNYASDVDN